MFHPAPTFEGLRWKTHLRSTILKKGGGGMVALAMHVRSMGNGVDDRAVPAHELALVQSCCGGIRARLSRHVGEFLFRVQGQFHGCPIAFACARADGRSVAR